MSLHRQPINCRNLTSASFFTMGKYELHFIIHKIGEKELRHLIENWSQNVRPTKCSGPRTFSHILNLISHGRHYCTLVIASRWTRRARKWLLKLTNNVAATIYWHWTGHSWVTTISSERCFQIWMTWVDRWLKLDAGIMKKLKCFPSRQLATAVAQNFIVMSSNGLQLKDVHLVGFSIGAQFGGLIGRELIAQSKHSLAIGRYYIL